MGWQAIWMLLCECACVYIIYLTIKGLIVFLLYCHDFPSLPWENWPTLRYGNTWRREERMSIAFLSSTPYSQNDQKVYIESNYPKPETSRQRNITEAMKTTHSLLAAWQVRSLIENFKKGRLVCFLDHRKIDICSFTWWYWCPIHSMAHHWGEAGNLWRS